MEGGAPLVPAVDGEADVAYLPGGCWVRVASEGAGGTLVEVGSVSAEAAEVKSIRHVYVPNESGGLALSRVGFSKITALGDE